MRLIIIGHWLLIFLLISGCAGTHGVDKQKVVVPTQKLYFSQPEVLKSTNNTFDINIKPIKVKKPYYIGFQLTVRNKTSNTLTIDWNRTRYIHNGVDQGKFFYKGIDPEDAKSGLPEEAIPGGALLSKPIYPLKTLNFSPEGDASKSGGGNFSPGILPDGTNAALLAIFQGDRQWRQAMTFKLATKESP